MSRAVLRRLRVEGRAPGVLRRAWREEGREGGKEKEKGRSANDDRKRCSHSSPLPLPPSLPPSLLLSLPPSLPPSLPSSLLPLPPDTPSRRPAPSPPLTPTTSMAPPPLPPSLPLALCLRAAAAPARGSGGRGGIVLGSRERPTRCLNEGGLGREEGRKAGGEGAALVTCMTAVPPTTSLLPSPPPSLPPSLGT